MKRPLDQVYDPHNQRDALVTLIRARTNNHVGQDLAGVLADDILSLRLDDPERDHERALAEIAINDANRRANLAEVALSSDRHKRKMYFLERGVVGIALQTVFGNIHERRGVFNLMAVVTFVLLIVVQVLAHG